MRLPHDLTRSHVLKAIDEINAGRIVVPPRERSKRYVVKRAEGTYPPKFLIRVAHRFLDGKDWPNIFGGGPEANNFLIDREFEVWNKEVGKRVLLHAEVEADESAFPEGRAVFSRHRRLERDSAIAKHAKDRRLERDGELVCDVCGFSFKKKYGHVGAGFIEAHHTVPVSELKGHRKTRVDEFALVCSNCHRMLHRWRPWLSVTELRQRLDPALDKS
jgi:hypothetical protein